MVQEAQILDQCKRDLAKLNDIGQRELTWMNNERKCNLAKQE